MDHLEMIQNKNFWKDKTVLITGHSGFKGTWLSLFLTKLGARVTGLSIDPPTKINIYNTINLKKHIYKDIYCNILDFNNLENKIVSIQPEIIFHLAAQSIVSRSFREPYYTYDTNFKGTLNILEILRKNNFNKPQVFINVTSDKSYFNDESGKAFTEEDRLQGNDIYSNSKSCSELITKSYYDNFFINENISIATARAGNVIGGGDWADDRLIPDFFRSVIEKKQMIIRNPHHIRPWQHVLESLNGYILLAEKLYLNKKLSGAWNFGPSYEDMLSVKDVISKILNFYPKNNVFLSSDINFYESSILKINSNKSNKLLGWRQQWDLSKSISNTIEWYSAYIHKENMFNFTQTQIDKFIDEG